MKEKTDGKKQSLHYRTPSLTSIQWRTTSSRASVPPTSLQACEIWLCPVVWRKGKTDRDDNTWTVCGGREPESLAIIRDHRSSAASLALCSIHNSLFRDTTCRDEHFWTLNRLHSVRCHTYRTREYKSTLQIYGSPCFSDHIPLLLYARERR